MTLLIDGYNLMHAAGIVGRGVGPGGLERSRRALLNFIVESLDETELERTIVVFDAAERPVGAADSFAHRGLRVRFASQHGDADSLIEELIGRDSAPRRLVVVSSDHRLHRAARRRRGQAIDSDRWYAEMVARRSRPAQPQATTPTAKPPPPAFESEVDYWLREMNLAPADEAAADESLDSFPPGYFDKDLDEPGE